MTQENAGGAVRLMRTRAADIVQVASQQSQQRSDRSLDGRKVADGCDRVKLEVESRGEMKAK